MGRAFVASLGLAILLCTGCGHAVVSPQSRVVESPEKKDFGLVGRWEVLPPPYMPEDPFGDDLPVISVTMDDAGVYHVEDESADEGDAGTVDGATLRATSLATNSEYAIVEIEATLPKGLEGEKLQNFLGIALRQGDNLFLWWVEGKKLSQAMKEEGHLANFTPGFLVSQVDAKPDDLLDTIRKHSAKLVGDPTTLRLVGK